MADDNPRPKVDPHEERLPYIYECKSCEERIEAERYPGDCPECGDEMQNLSKPSER